MVSGLRALYILTVRVAMALALSTLAAPQLAFAISDQEYWNETSLEITDVEALVNTQNCYKNENNFLGCISAMDILLAASVPAKALSNQYIEQFNHLKETITFVQLPIKRYEPAPSEQTSLVESWKVKKHERDVTNASWKNIYHATKKSPISFEAIKQYALDQLAPKNRRFHFANSINAYLKNAVDPHTYITPVEKWKASIAREKQTVGIGVILKAFGDKIILEPNETGPAEKAGIQNMDILNTVDGQSVAGMTTKQVVELIKGTENTAVTLNITRDEETFDVEIVRALYNVVSLRAQLLNDPITKRKIGHIKISTFNEKGICSKFMEQAKALHAQGAETLILDLRSNAGGLVDEANCMVSAFLKPGQTIITKNDPITNEVKERLLAKEQDSLFELYGNKPLFILQNAGSASASEILAGSLSTYGKAIVIGERSYGKGTMQNTDTTWTASFMSGYKKIETIARFHFVNGTSNQIVGIRPDIVMPIKPNATEEDRFALREVDNYPNAVAPAAPLTGFPQKGIEAIRSCIMTRAALSKKHSIDLGIKKLAGDYQLLVAREAASCHIGRK